MGKTLFQKIWDAHTVGILPDGRTQMFIATHLLHEVTSPQAFGMVRDLGLTVRHPERTFATVDHIIPTDNQAEPFADATADAMIRELRRNCAENGIRFFDLPTGLQGIVHMVGPELGITQPGMTIVCGDSHTATHGAFGSIAMGIGTTQVRRWNWSARKPEKDLPAPPVGSVWLGPARKSPQATVEREPA